MEPADAHEELCRLELIAGHEERCPGASCPFWEPGGAVVEGGCVLERVGFELDRRPEVAALLLDDRHRIEDAHDETDAEAARMQLAHALNAENVNDVD